jgi:TRAP-type C4-dicarboxylate transport system permease small subunit
VSRIHFPRPANATAAALSLTAGLFLLVLVLLTVADVVSRNLQDQSILGTVDISTILLVGVAFLGLASAEIDGRHVSVGLIEVRLSLRTRMVLSAVRGVLLVVLGILLTWGLAEVLFSSIDRGETTNDILRLPTWPAKLVLLVSFVLFFAGAIWKELTEFRAFRSGQVLETSEVEAVLEQAYAAEHQRESEAVR